MFSPEQHHKETLFHQTSVVDTKKQTTLKGHFGNYKCYIKRDSRQCDFVDGTGKFSAHVGVFPVSEWNVGLLYNLR